MSNQLDQIIATKNKEVELLVKKEDQDKAKTLEKILNQPKINHHRFKNALKVAGLSVIAEIKRKSPSKGPLAKIVDPVELAHEYSKAGASAISVLTDKDYFGGSLEDLEEVVVGLDALHPCPVLRKDFIIHPYQIAESKQLGASAVLLIVAVLKEGLLNFLNIAEHIGIDALVEVHNEEELKMALDANAQIIGVNNRNLVTFEVDLEVAKGLAHKIPKDVIKVAESGILTVQQAHEMHQCGYDSVLIGEMLVKSKDPRKIISEIGNM